MVNQIKEWKKKKLYGKFGVWRLFLWIYADFLLSNPLDDKIFEVQECVKIINFYRLIWLESWSIEVDKLDRIRIPGSQGTFK